MTDCVFCDTVGGRVVGVIPRVAGPDYRAHDRAELHDTAERIRSVL